jgi:hypothetical protein
MKFQASDKIYQMLSCCFHVKRGKLVISEFASFSEMGLNETSSLMNLRIVTI